MERYIEIWIEDYLKAISKLALYSELDKKIQEAHFKLSIGLIHRIMDKWDKYDSLSREDVLKNLHHCAENKANYKINTTAFTIRSSNMKHKRIVEIFGNLNIKLNEKLIQNEALNQEIGLAPNKITRIEQDTLYAKLNYIVDRRNDIAHGVEIDSLLRNSELIPYIDFIEKYCQAIFDVLMQEYFRLESIHKFQQIEVVHKVWKKSTLGFEIEKHTIGEAFTLFEVISEGDVIIVETTDGRFYKKPILELQKENVRYPSLLITDKTNIAVRVEPPINKNCKFYIERK